MSRSFWTRMTILPICAAAVILILLYPYFYISWHPTTLISSFGQPDDAFADLTIYVSNPTLHTFSYWFSFDLWVMENSTRAANLTIFYFGENSFPDGIRVPFSALRHDEGVHYNISGRNYQLWTYDYVFNRTTDVSKPENFPLDVYESETFYVWLNETIYPSVHLRATSKEGFCTSLVDKGVEDLNAAYEQFPLVQKQIFGRPQINPMLFQVRTQRDFPSILLFCAYLGFLMLIIWWMINVFRFIEHGIETEIQVFATMSISSIAFIWVIRQFVITFTWIELVIITGMSGWFLVMTHPILTKKKDDKKDKSGAEPSIKENRETRLQNWYISRAYLKLKESSDYRKLGKCAEAVNSAFESD